MREAKRQSRDGFTMVEMLVVIAIIMLLSAIAVPGFVRLVRPDHLSASSSTLFSMLRSARLYSSTFHVNTAVVYAMDNYVPPPDDDSDPDDPANNPVNGLAAPVVDSVSNLGCRVIRAAAVMYALPLDSRDVAFRPNPATNNNLGVFVPVSGELGQFRTFPGNMGVLLADVDLLPKAIGDNPDDGIVYRSLRPRFSKDFPDSEDFYVEDVGKVTIGKVLNLGLLGMTWIKAYTREAGPLVRCDEGYCDPRYKWKPESMMAHVFVPTGRLITDAVNQERFRLFMAPSPTADFDERLVYIDPEIKPWWWYQKNPGDIPQLNLMGKYIEITRSSGQVTIVK